MSRVLIIDDDKDFLAIMKTFLSAQGYEVKVQDKWRNANEQIKTFKPHLIILDVFLPDHDGLTACKTLKNNSYTRKIPVLIVSGYSKLRENALQEFGAEAFMAKPFTAPVLAGTVKKMIERN